MKFVNIFLLFFCFNTFLSKAQSHNFSYKFGLSAITGAGIPTETLDYFTLEASPTHPFNFYPVQGLQYEYRPQNVKRIGLNAEIHTHKLAIFVYTEDSHPDLPFSPHGVNLTHDFRHIAISAGPSFHLGRFVKLIVGLDIQYNFRVGERGWDWEAIPGDPNTPSRRRNEMADAVSRHLRMKPFSVNTFVAAELRFWRMGFEGRVSNPLTGNLLRELQMNGYSWNTQYYVQNILMLTTKVYLRKI